MAENYEVFVRAKTSDNRWATVSAFDLDDRSFRQLVMHRLVEAGLLTGMKVKDEPLTTPLTKAQAEGDV